MRKILLSVIALAGLSACTATQVSLATTDTCSTNAAVVSGLADVKSKLTAAQVKAVDTDISVIDPVCSAASPPTTLTGVAATAAQELASILAGVK